MTREEAVIILRCVEAHGSLVKEAKEKAIEALEQEPCVTMRDLSEEELKHFAEEMKKVRVQVVKQESILDKIRAEIEQLQLHKAQFITSDSKVCIDSQEVLNIIDKYKVESEG